MLIGHIQGEAPGFGGSARNPATTAAAGARPFGAPFVEDLLGWLIARAELAPREELPSPSFNFTMVTTRGGDDAEEVWWKDDDDG